MDIQAYKYNLIEELTKVQDIKLLEKIASFLQKEKDENLSNALNIALNEVAEGKLTPHDEVMAQLRKNYSK